MRVGLMGASDRTGLFRALSKGFAGSGVEIVSLRNTEGGFREAVREIDVVQVTAFGTTRYWVLPALLARLMGKPVVRYWVGSDVLRLQQSAAERRRARLADLVISANVVQWHNLRKELGAMGIRSRVIPAPHPGSVTEPLRQLPQPFTMLSYVSSVSWKWDLYGGDVIIRLAQRYPQWRFIILNHSGDGLPDLPNIEYLPRVEPSAMDGVYARTSVLVRITSHDGLPRMILEALARGLHVVWSRHFPHCRFAGTYREVCQALESLAENPEINEAGSSYIAQAYHPGVLAERWLGFYAGLCRKEP